jgi:hypothetical protein
LVNPRNAGSCPLTGRGQADNLDRHRRDRCRLILVACSCPPWTAPNGGGLFRDFLGKGDEVSQTESFGVDPGRWVGVAAAMADYLGKWLEANGQARPRPPRGIFAGARRFFEQVIEGVALNRRQRIRNDIPAMAGIANLTIAVSVLSRLPADPQDLDTVQQIVTKYLDCLQAISAEATGLVADSETVREMKSFFLELQEQGNRARHAGFGRAESPAK